MQSLMVLGCFDQKLSKINLWGSARPLGKRRVKKVRNQMVKNFDC